MVSVRGGGGGGGNKILVFHTRSRVVSAMERVCSKNLYTNNFTPNELWNFRLMFLKTLAHIRVFTVLKTCKGPVLENYPCSELLLYSVHDYFVENPLFDDFLDILNQILWGILFGSASRVNWDKLTVIEMVQDSESVSQRDWFICHIFWVWGLEIITL